MKSTTITRFRFTKLKSYQHKKRCAVYFFMIISLFMIQSCDVDKEITPTHLNEQASIDFSNTKEGKSSALEYNSNTGFNDEVSYVWTLWGEPVFSTPAFNLDGGLNEYFTPEKKVNSSITLNPGLGYVGKGAKQKDDNIKFRLNYLEIPIYALYHYKIGDMGGIYGGLGPYFAYGIGGKVKGEGFSQSSFGENNGGYKRFDAGIGFKAGYEFSNGVFADLTYELGLANIAYASLDITSHNKCFSINLGYNIGRLFAKKKK